jgi:hypothetical protein
MGPGIEPGNIETVFQGDPKVTLRIGIYGMGAMEFDSPYLRDIVPGHSPVGGVEAAQSVLVCLYKPDNTGPRSNGNFPGPAERGKDVLLDNRFSTDTILAQFLEIVVTGQSIEIYGKVMGEVGNDNFHIPGRKQAVFRLQQGIIELTALL